MASRPPRQRHTCSQVDAGCVQGWWQETDLPSLVSTQCICQVRGLEGRVQQQQIVHKAVRIMCLLALALTVWPSCWVALNPNDGAWVALMLEIQRGLACKQIACVSECRTGYLVPCAPHWWYPVYCLCILLDTSVSRQVGKIAVACLQANEASKK